MTTTDHDSSGQPGPDGESVGPGQDAGVRNLADAAARMLEGYARMMAEFSGGGARRDGCSAPVGDLSAALVEAWSIAAGSTLRYQQGLAEIFARHQGAMIGAASAHLSAERPTPDRTLAEAEDLRRFLREVGETAMLEARRLEHDLEALGEAIAQGVAPTATDEDRCRYWAVKP